MMEFSGSKRTRVPVAKEAAGRGVTVSIHDGKDESRRRVWSRSKWAKWPKEVRLDAILGFR
jgi:hypothetical protein